MKLPTFDDVREAAGRIAVHAVRTPLIESPALTSRVGARVLFKVETLQRVGAFKFRGAYNRISRTDREQFPGGVVASSSGNHAQGVAEAARLLDLDALVVMPRDAPRIKIERTKAMGAKVVLYDREKEDREGITRKYASDRQADLIHPFDDPWIIAGQGTAGLELIEDAAKLGVTIDHVLVPVSGGGLATGVALAVKALSPSTKVHPVEPAGFDDMKRSLASGSVQHNTKMSGSICDALMQPHPGEITFPLARTLLSEGLSATDDEVRAAIRVAFETLKLVVEPGGVIGLAALLSGALPVEGKTFCVILSGGNIDPVQFAEILIDE